MPKKTDPTPTTDENDTRFIIVNPLWDYTQHPPTKKDVLLTRKEMEAQVAQITSRGQGTLYSVYEIKRWVPLETSIMLDGKRLPLVERNQMDTPAIAQPVDLDTLPYYEEEY